MIGEYEPVRIDTTSAKLESELTFEKGPGGVRLHRLALDPRGGMSAELIHIAASANYTYRGNYLLTLKGDCEIEGRHLRQGTLMVATTIEPQSYVVRPGKGAACFALGVSFS